MAKVLYDRAIICNSGHVISSMLDYLPQELPNFCSQCSAPVMTKCTNCGTEIQGSRYVERIENYLPVGALRTNQRTVKHYDVDYTIPLYCSQCQHHFPWTESLLIELDEIISMADELDEVDRAILHEKFPLLLLPNIPGTTTAALRVSRVLKTALPQTVTALKSALFSKLAGNVLEILGWK